MSPTYESIMDAALQLQPEDRRRIASRLWESLGNAPVSPDDPGLEYLLNQRDAELDADPALEIGHQEFLINFSGRRGV